MGDEKLTGKDYMTRSYIELQSHPDFSEWAFRRIAAMKTMTTEELEKIRLKGATNGHDRAVEIRRLFDRMS